MKIFKYEQTSSTQDLAKTYLKKHRKIAGFVAKSQTAAYGKQGRFFYAPKDTGIYFSLAIPNFNFDFEKINRLTPLIAIKIVKVLKKEFDCPNLQIKWVNDLYLNSKKVGGILTEKIDNDLVIGIGLNINTEAFPDNLKNKAGKISNQNFNLDDLCSSLIKASLLASQEYQKADFLNEYRKLSFVLNKKVHLLIGKKLITAKVVDFDQNGRIVVLIDQEKKTFSSGEIEKVLID